MTRAGQESLRPKCFMATLSVGRLDDTVPSQEIGDTWGVVIWVGCLFEYSPVTYTLSVSSNGSIHAASYTGKDHGKHKIIDKLHQSPISRLVPLDNSFLIKRNCHLPEYFTRIPHSVINNKR